MNKKSCLAGICLAVVPVMASFASTPSLEEVIVTTNRTGVGLDTAFGSWSKLDQGTLLQIQPTHIQQALERVPGVNLHRNNGQEYLPAIRSPVLSGPGACGSFLMAEDGIPIRPAGFCNANELFESHFEQASSIEIARGPSVALFGSNALHGIINIINPARIDGTSRVGVEVGANDYNQLKTHLSNDVSSLALSLSHDGGYRDDSGVDQQKLSLQHRLSREAYTLTTGLTATNLNQETAGYAVGNSIYKDRSEAEKNPNPEAFRDAWAVRAWGRFEQNNDRPGWVITPYLRTSRMSFLQHFLPGAPLEENGQQSLGLQSVFHQYYLNSQLTYGLDLEVVQGWLKETQDSPIEEPGFLQSTIPAGKHYDFEVTGLQVSPFIQWQKEIGTKLSTTLGLRYEMMRYDYDNQMLDGRTNDKGVACGFGGCRFSRPSDRNDNFDNWNPSFGLQYRLSEQQTIALLVSRSFRVPQTGELYRLQREQSVADLDSEHLDSIELALRGSTEKSRYELTAYAMKKSNVIFRDTSFFTVSDGKTSHYGLEGSIKSDLTDTIAINLSASYARHRYNNPILLSDIDIDGNDVDTAPRLFGSVQLQWLPLDKVEVELDWQHMGKYYTDPENRHEYPGHDVFNLRSRWSPGNALTLSLRILNLFDTHYAKRADYSGFAGDRYFPGEPRSVYVGLEYAW